MRKKGKRRFILVLLAMAICAGATYVTLSPVFSIKEITIAGNNRISDEEVSRLLPFSPGDHILFLKKKMTKRLLSSDDRVVRCEIHRRYPDKVDIIIEEMSPVMLLSAGKVWGLNEKGTILPIETPFEIPNLPFLSLVGCEISPVAYRRIEGDAIRKGLDFWTETQRTSPQFLDRISEIIVDDKLEVRLVLSGDGIIVDVGSGDFERRLLRLKTLLSEIERIGNNADYIDLRYGDQAIVRLDKSYKNKQSG